MKKIWKSPELEVLDVSMTMWHPPKGDGGGGKDPDPSTPPEEGFDS